MQWTSANRKHFFPHEGNRIAEVRVFTNTVKSLLPGTGMLQGPSGFKGRNGSWSVESWCTWGTVPGKFTSLHCSVNVLLQELSRSWGPPCSWHGVTSSTGGCGDPPLWHWVPAAPHVLQLGGVCLTKLFISETFLWEHLFIQIYTLRWLITAGFAQQWVGHSFSNE